MSITFQLPGDIEERLRREFPDLDQAAKESVLVELYRRGKLSQHELAHALGLSRYQTDGLLKSHGVTEDLVSPDEQAAQVEQLRRLVG
jgi:predicted HTH domain antitoxin